MAKFEARQYWDARVGPQATLADVGQDGFGVYNRIAYRFRQRAFLRAVAGLPLDATVFEAGFGNGFYLTLWKRLGIVRVVGVDFSSGAVAGAQRQFPDYQFFQHDLTEPLKLAEAFDVVTAIDVLYHIVDDEGWRTALRSLCDLVRPGGCLMLTDKFPANRPFQTAAHVRRRPLSWYLSSLQQHDMTIERVVPVFLLMDDPIPTGQPGWFAKLTYMPWRLMGKTIRMLRHWPTVRDTVALSAAMLQLPFEYLGLSIFRRTPNLELLVARKGTSASPSPPGTQ